MFALFWISCHKKVSVLSFIVEDKRAVRLHCVSLMCGNTASIGVVSRSIPNWDKGLQALKRWRGKRNATLVFDTDTDGWDHDKLNVIFKKPSNAVVAVTNEGDVFGAFVSVAINMVNEYFRDDDQFVFSFFLHGRCAVPQKWELTKNRVHTDLGVLVFPSSSRNNIFFRLLSGFGFVHGVNESVFGLVSFSFDG